MSESDFPGGTVDKNSPAKAEDMCPIPNLGRLHMPGATQPTSHNSWAPTLQLLKPTPLEPVLGHREAAAIRSPHAARNSDPCSQLQRKPALSNEGSVQPKIDK